MGQSEVVDALRAWARGDYGIEAAVELLARVHDGRFLAPSWPWIHSEGTDRYWVDFSAAVRPGVGLSGGELRVLKLAASLAGEGEVNLGDTLPHLDRGVVAVVLAAVSHAAGTHEHVEYLSTRDESGTNVLDLFAPRIAPGPLHDWPPGDVASGNPSRF